MTPRRIDTIGVVVPVHDEAERLARCLSGLARARALLGSGPGAPQVRVVVVLDRCTDGSARVAARFGGVERLAVRAGGVGRARAAGAEHLLDGRADRLWLACTDADSQVPPGWLGHQLGMARAGVDLLLGTVRPLLDQPDPRRYAAWASGYLDRPGHPHVHGANLAVRGDVYLACGGFPPVPSDEDVALADTARSRGLRVVSSPAHPVATSARTAGRAPHGFAAYLDALPGSVPV